MLHAPAPHSYDVCVYVCVCVCAQASVADARRWEQKVKALTFELDSCRKLKDDAISDLTLQNSQLKHQLKV